LARAANGSLSDCWPELRRLNSMQSGISVAVNEIYGVRAAENVKRIRAVWFDDDEAKMDSSKNLALLSVS